MEVIEEGVGVGCLGVYVYQNVGKICCYFFEVEFGGFEFNWYWIGVFEFDVEGFVCFDCDFVGCKDFVFYCDFKGFYVFGVG